MEVYLQINAAQRTHRSAQIVQLAQAQVGDQGSHIVCVLGVVVVVALWQPLAAPAARHVSTHHPITATNLQGGCAKLR